MITGLHKTRILELSLEAMGVAKDCSWIDADCKTTRVMEAIMDAKSREQGRMR